MAKWPYLSTAACAVLGLSSIGLRGAVLVFAFCALTALLLGVGCMFWSQYRSAVGADRAAILAPISTAGVALAVASWTEPWWSALLTWAVGP